MVPPGYVRLVASLPTPWPPPGLVVLTKQQVNGCAVELLADDDGRLGFSVSFGQETRLHMFQRILVSEQGMSAMDFGWSDEEASMRFRGTQLLEDATGDAPVAYFDLSSAPKPTKGIRIYSGLQTAAVADPDSRFFLETLLDIDTKVAAGDSYQLIRAAGLLRQVVLDGEPLVHKANRAHRLKLTFSVLDPDQYPPSIGPELLVFWRNLDPSPFPGGQIVSIDLARLLSSNILWYAKTWATVRDVIKACANAKGGIHFGKPEGPAQEVVLQFDRELVGVSGEPSLMALSGLCRIILNGVRPLVSAVSNAG